MSKTDSSINKPTNPSKRPQKIKTIPNCPECNVPLGDCDCNFHCPACNELGDYQSSGAILCPSDDCRVGRFSTQ